MTALVSRVVSGGRVPARGASRPVLVVSLPAWCRLGCCESCTRRPSRAVVVPVSPSLLSLLPLALPFRVCGGGVPAPMWRWSW